MGSRKRGRDEMESSEPATEQGLLDRVRNKWEFANIMQYIFIFGKAVKIDEDLTIEVRCSYIGSDNLVIAEAMQTLLIEYSLTDYAYTGSGDRVCKARTVPDFVRYWVGLAQIRLVASRLKVSLASFTVHPCF